TVVAAVAVGVGEHAQAAAGRAVAIHTERVSTHLQNPEPAVRAPVEGNWILNQRFGGNEFDLETWPSAHSPERFLGRKWTRLTAGEQLLKRAPVHLVR